METTQLAITATKGRLLALQCVYEAASGHPGGSMSAMDLLTVLYFDVMHIDPQNAPRSQPGPLCSVKGTLHTCALFHLGITRLFPCRRFAQVPSHRRPLLRASRYGPCERRGYVHRFPGTGDLRAVGMAMAGKLDHKDYRVYTILGDGEIEEGQTWEAAMAASKYKLDNLCAIVDVNGLQIDGKTSDVMPSEPLDKKYEAFGWHVIQCDGHDYASIQDALASAKAVQGQPTMILAKTVKGKGISYMENNAGWHGKAPNDEQYELGKLELTELLKKLEAE